MTTGQKHIRMKEIAVSDFVLGESEPEVMIYGTASQMEDLCELMLSGGSADLASEIGPSGTVRISHEPEWRVPDHMIDHTDTVEGHLAWTAGARFELEIRAEPNAFVELVDSIRTELLQSDEGHLHRESYLRGGQLCDAWVSYIFGLVS
jgi:hypothetical protein